MSRVNGESGAPALPDAARDREAAEREKADIRFMRRALKLAEKAAALGEVPIGCVIVRDGRVIGSGYNRRLTDHTTLAHAELIAIRKACRRLGDWRLEGCTMYVTLEPCQMCAGALVQSRIDHVVMGCRNPKAGCAGSILNLLQEPAFNHQVEITEGVLGEECSQVLQTFFKQLRVRLKSEKAARAADAGEEEEAEKQDSDTAEAVKAAAEAGEPCSPKAD